MDLNLKSLGFLLLRQHGYHIPQDIQGNIDENGTLKGHLYEDIIGVLNLYEASYHSVEDESILDGATIFTEKYLKESMKTVAAKILCL
ncbi:putative lyase [Helianthus annuus]|uniref:Lyase n=1 Tax=Helianthus annuus TaxID=4232 RepID=A0A9K3P0I5_HELAN|nr:putative lyase [Helianthus annuus]KAJ0605600.1 putative lyase [Helianthus annuus]KAJ0619615.1 putative lyase [Helianthus annuus]KAJ0787075.1 putative lyase [Helianthus annuus]KAJ0806181.1 putative lyase [Helianthus annuus]